MLIITFHNIDEKNNIADYDITIYVNQKKIDEMKIKGHYRVTGWRGLILDFADQLRKEKSKKENLK